MPQSGLLQQSFIACIRIVDSSIKKLYPKRPQPAASTPPHPSVMNRQFQPGGIKP